MADQKGKEFRGNRNLKRLARIPQAKQQEEIRRSLRYGLDAAKSVTDRTISCFSRGHQPAFAGINTFMKAPYCEDVRSGSFPSDAESYHSAAELRERVPARERT